MKKFLFLLVYIFCFQVYASELIIDDELENYFNFNINNESLTEMPNAITKKFNIEYKNKNYIFLKEEQLSAGRISIFYKDQFVGKIEYEARGNNIYYIAKLILESKFRNQQIGEFLLRTTCLYLIKKGAQEIYLIASPIGEGAMENRDQKLLMLYKFYQRCGFEKKEEAGSYLYLKSKL